jgi:hypothetical protein
MDEMDGAEAVGGSKGGLYTSSTQPLISVSLAVI